MSIATMLRRLAAVCLGEAVCAMSTNLITARVPPALSRPHRSAGGDATSWIVRPDLADNLLRQDSVCHSSRAGSGEIPTADAVRLLIADDLCPWFRCVPETVRLSRRVSVLAQVRPCAISPF